MIVKRWISSDRVYQMCNRYNYYTRGDCRAYDAMLAIARNLDADDYVGLLTIAKDIYNHSTLKDEEEYASDHVAGIVYALLSECTDMYVKLNEGEVL